MKLISAEGGSGSLFFQGNSYAGYRLAPSTGTIPFSDITHS